VFRRAIVEALLAAGAEVNGQTEVYIPPALRSPSHRVCHGCGCAWRQREACTATKKLRIVI
jgi:hypothetical protein